MDFTSDEIDETDDSQAAPTLPLSSPQAKNVSKPRKRPAATEGKNPVMLLNELVPGLQFECTEETGDAKSKIFTMEVELKGRKYQGFGKSKKLAKAGAATKALLDEFNITTSSPSQQPVPSNTAGEEGAADANAGNLPDLVYNLVRIKFAELTDDYKADIAKHKVLAGFVMTRDNSPNVSTGEVISLATGTKCVSGKFISDQGAALFDCHAEIVSRRGLRRYFYEQLLTYSSDSEDCIFERTDTGRFRLKPDVYFHLYISTSPCGDARIFSPHEVEKSSDDHPNRKSRGQLRTKIESGEGTIPVDESNYVREKGGNKYQQTWDGVISGERLLTMSCSDKIAKWNVVGVQGSLLSHLIEPVYVSSIVLGSLYHAQHLQRAVFARANEALNAVVNEEVQQSLNCRVHRPLLAPISSKEHRKPMRAPTFCVHWSQGDTEPYTIQTNTGRKENGDVSNLCKKEMYRLFSEVCTMHGFADDLKLSTNPTYAELKRSAKDYQKIKDFLVEGFRKTSTGSWIGKPDEVDMFSC